MARPLIVQSGGEGVVLDSAGLMLIAKGTTVPVDGRPGFATGCLFLHTDGGSGDALYCNEGTSASCDFDLVSVA